MIYTSPSFWVTATGDSKKFARNGHPLWIANWRVHKPTVPAGNWAGHGWTFWQWTDCGEVNGIKGCVDKDRYGGRSVGRYGAAARAVSTTSAARSYRPNGGIR
jgi:lysozyme